MTDTLPRALYRAEQTRELDRRAIEEAGIPGYRLMCRAGEAALDTLRQQWPGVGEITVYCGAGNNGGDGYVIARLAQAQGIRARVVQLVAPERLLGEAAQAWREAVAAAVPMSPFDQALTPRGVLVDALLGTGLQGAVRGDFTRAIEQINQSGLPVLAVDIPSGLCADTGAELGCAVRADVTVTFIGFKQGLFTGRGPALVGALAFDALQLPDSLLAAVPPASRLLVLEDMQAWLARRSRDAHKGHYGHLLVVGGDHGYAGAALMAAQAAGRVGAGLVSLATRPEHVAAAIARQPEIMAHGIDAGLRLQPLLERASAVVVGPGLGRAAWGEQMLWACLESGLPLVVDADALGLLAERRILPDPHRHNWILTPHPGEAARMLQCATAEISADRFHAARRLQAEFGGSVVLKGAGTLVEDEHGVGICPYGNPGMASGGMGDVLSGVLGGLLAQGFSPGEAARLGACLHGRAADLAAAEGERGLLATDLLPHLRALANPEDVHV